MINSLKTLIPNSGKDFVRRQIMMLNTKIFNSNNITFSQTGEDVILRNYFKGKENGFYVDIGAFHPVIVSNTNFFYTYKNWRGLNVDACPGSMELFKKLRPRDINLEIAVSENDDFQTYYFIDKTSTMNTFSKNFLIENNLLNKVTKEIKIKTQTLENLLENNLPKSTQIDFLTLDAEGYDLNILKSNNWNKYRPEIIIVETDLKKIEKVYDSNIVKYVISNGYEIISIIQQEEGIKNIFFRNIFVNNH